MSNLNEQLDSFSKELIGFEDLTTRVKTLVEKDPTTSSDFMLALSEAHDSGVLSSEQYYELLENIVESDTFAVTNAESDDYDPDST